jgi:hypothetical protein
MVNPPTSIAIEANGQAVAGLTATPARFDVLNPVIA